MKEIPLKFGLFWSGGELSFLRFLTFLSIRKHHPDSEIELYISGSFYDCDPWENELQDFQLKKNKKNYIEFLPSVGVKVIKAELFSTFSPNFQSDLFRWWWLYNNGGFYLDTDQIILKSFKGLPLYSDFIFSSYRATSCGLYSPVGVLGAKKELILLKEVKDNIMSYYNPLDYNSIGPSMFSLLLQENAGRWSKELSLFNSPPNFFYPVKESKDIGSVFSKDSFISDASYALHWFGGSSLSQDYNLKFDESYPYQNDDMLSRLSRPLVDFWKDISSQTA